MSYVQFCYWNCYSSRMKNKYFSRSWRLCLLRIRFCKLWQAWSLLHEALTNFFIANLSNGALPVRGKFTSRMMGCIWVFVPNECSVSCYLLEMKTQIRLVCISLILIILLVTYQPTFFNFITSVETLRLCDYDFSLRSTSCDCDHFTQWKLKTDIKHVFNFTKARAYDVM